MKRLVLDIETLPVDLADAAKVAYLVSSVTADTRLKDPEKVAADIAQKQSEAVSKTGLDGAFGRVLMATVGDVETGELVTIASETANEALVLSGLLQTLDNLSTEGPGQQRPICIIGHNIGWDLRFLAQRCVVQGVKLNRRLLPYDAKPWDNDRLFDTMTAWAGVGNRITLDRLCVALGVESPKGEMDGSQVAEYYAAGRFDEIVTYNRADVLATMQVFAKMREAGMA